MRFDVVIYDSICSSYGAQYGLGGSEISAIRLAEAVAAKGYSVAFFTDTFANVEINGVHYKFYSFKNMEDVTCGTLLIQRYSDVPNIPHDRLLVVTHDMWDESAFGHLEPVFHSGEATLVCLGEWQRAQYPKHWKSVVVRGFIPDFVYDLPHTDKIAGRYIYAHAAMKGLRETIAMWTVMRAYRPDLFKELRVISSWDQARVPANLGITHLQPMAPDEVFQEIAAAEAMFYVNVFPEIYPTTTAAADVLDTRPHIMCMNGFGGIQDVTGTASLVTNDLEQFIESLVFYGNGVDDYDYRSLRDHRLSTILPKWLELLVP